MSINKANLEWTLREAERKGNASFKFEMEQQILPAKYESMPYRLAVRMLISVLEHHCLKVPEDAGSSRPRRGDIHAFYAGLLLYLTTRPKVLSLTALRCFVLHYAGTEVLTDFDEIIRKHKDSSDLSPIREQKPSPNFLLRMSLVGAFLCLLDIDWHKLDFIRHIGVHDAWRHYCTPIDQPNMTSDELDILKTRLHWKWDVSDTVSKLTLAQSQKKSDDCFLD